ncbi:MAG TPA: LysR substrate-binding domain-containing protein [Gallionella sp.]|nr:LysR substrate-binding domain-containing protein [Gallionella sp.]
MSVPLHRLASLDLIRGFVAVGRRMSITLAAEDLCLTQSAVSRQVQALEEALGVNLLNRASRAISFTPEGERLFKVADGVVQQLQEVCGALSDAGERVPVTITGCISVTGLWLLPRLGKLQQRYPDIEVRIASNDKPLDPKATGADIAIRYCAESNAPAGAVRLFSDTVLPVIHPSLLKPQQSLRDAIDYQVLLEFDNPKYPWLHWSDFLSSLGADAPKPRGMLRFNQYNQVIQAAMAGQGIALGRVALVAPMLADKRLAVLKPDAAARSSGYSYWLVQADAQPRQQVRDVAAWIKAEAQLDDAM